MSQLADREVFARYVREITRVQRAHVADRTERLVRHQARMWHYFFGCITGTTAVVLGVFKLSGPRHLFSHQAYYIRPIPPAIAMGLTMYGILYTCRGMIMRYRLCMMIEDYEFELKQVKAHHCEEGVTQLAWLEFVMDQLRQCHESRFDIIEVCGFSSGGEKVDKSGV